MKSLLSTARLLLLIYYLFTVYSWMFAFYVVFIGAPKALEEQINILSHQPNYIEYNRSLFETAIMFKIVPSKYYFIFNILITGILTYVIYFQKNKSLLIYSFLYFLMFWISIFIDGIIVITEDRLMSTVTLIYAILSTKYPSSLLALEKA